MEKMQDLKDLLKHELQDLYSAETQLIEALPKMAENATNPELKKALQQHLRVTENQKNRLDQITNLFGNEEGDGENGGLMSRLFGGSKSVQKCIGMEAVIKEGEKLMGEEMNSEVMDAAIIAAAQKSEHYEICGYGTAKAYARELELGKIAELLEQTLDEEYEADDRLTDLAIGGLNEKADQAGDNSRGLRRRGSSNNSRGGNSNNASGGRSKSASKSSSSGRAGTSKGASGSASKSSGSKTASKKSASSKGSSSSRSGGSSGSTSRSGSKSSGGRSSKSASKNSRGSSRSKSSSGGRK